VLFFLIEGVSKTSIAAKTTSCGSSENVGAGTKHWRKYFIEIVITKYKKLSYSTVTARRSMLVSSCFTSYGS